MVPIFTAGELNMALGDFNFDQRNHSTCHNDKRGASLRYWSRHIFIELFHKWDLYFGNWILKLRCIETLKFYITKCQYTLSLQLWVLNENFSQTLSLPFQEVLLAMNKIGSKVMKLWKEHTLMKDWDWLEEMDGLQLLVKEFFLRLEKFFYLITTGAVTTSPRPKCGEALVAGRQA